MCSTPTQRKTVSQFLRVADTPGTVFNQQIAEELAQAQAVVLICGHYAGIDGRVDQHLATREISIWRLRSYWR